MTNSSFQMDCYCGILPNPSVLMFTLDAATCFISTCSYSYTHTQTHNLICFFKRFLITPHYLWNQIESLLPCNLKDTLFCTLSMFEALIFFTQYSNPLWCMGRRHNIMSVFQEFSFLQVTKFFSHTLHIQEHSLISIW